jgi:hypothetical protein
MKKLICTIIIIFIAGYSLVAQNIIDSNTRLIENYFQQQETDNLSLKIENNPFVTNKPEIIIIQLGNYNNVNVLAIENTKQELTQIGNYNNYEHYSFFNSIESQLKIDQNGDNNDIQIYGQNAIIKNLQINQNTNNQTIIINNY